MGGLVSKSLHEIAIEEAREELTDYTVYKKLSQMETAPKARKVFTELTEAENRHYHFWKKYCPNTNIKPDMLKVYLILSIRRIMGPSFAIKYLEGTETKAIKKYEGMRSFIPHADKKAFEAMIKDEEHHEQAFARQVQGNYVKYISFIVLGLADALVEIAGIHAGSLGIYASTELTGLAGIVAGAAASISMASAAFAQAKQGFKGSARLAAAYTGVSYFVSAVFLATPYFLTSSMAAAITISIVVGLLIIAFVSWYNSVISGGNLTRDFAELASIMLLATAALFVFGLAIKHVLGITI